MLNWMKMPFFIYITLQKFWIIAKITGIYIILPAFNPHNSHPASRISSAPAIIFGKDECILYSKTCSDENCVTLKIH